MTAPRIDVDLEKIRLNAQCLVNRLKPRGIGVTGVTKAVCGHPDIANAMLHGGVTGLAETRIANAERMRRAGIACPISMLRTPMLSQIDRITKSCGASYNTEIAVIASLAEASLRQNEVHNIILMVEMGDMREGIEPGDLETIARQVTRMPGVALKGIGANYACLNGMVPDNETMLDFSMLANDIEGACGPFIETVSGGNSANLPWAMSSQKTGRINDLRLGEAILLGVDPISGQQIGGLYRDAFTLTAEVIEAKSKPEPPTALISETASSGLRLVPDCCDKKRSILAIGHQDIDISGLVFPPGIVPVGATSDHLVVEAYDQGLQVGSEVSFQLKYSALMRSMSAPGIEKIMRHSGASPIPELAKRNRSDLALV
ncbi:alanine/ornithine racemase family PLP-dependent enzyme [uncultured Roseovarius sp.]|uniref:alanine/ornithine racemase family PLP-dependent enzyme n=1 Tax=uncultured Roseovarius sp. TaxID=293344 RepID=UPI0026123099|nr:alanine/ornithine racemase family PLP-dependent enzyme [uncultured Roseovarius sp.]